MILIWGFIDAKQYLSINIGDTYIAISRLHFAILLSLIYGFLTLLYFALIKLNFRFINWMTITHVLVSIIGLLFIFVLPQLMRNDTKFVGFDQMILNINFNNRLLLLIWLSVFTILGIQLLFFVNVIYALIKGRK